jgi:hypothetical protein
MHFVKWLAPACGLLLLAACADRKEDAERAMVAARNSVAAMREDAARYAPDDLAHAQNLLGQMEHSFEGGDYDAVMEGVSRFEKGLESAEAKVAGGRKVADQAIADAVMRWNQLDRSVPPLIALAEERARSGSQAAKTGAANTEAAIADLRAAWLQASSAFASGRPVEAVQQADDIERRARALLQQLGINVS